MTAIEQMTHDYDRELDYRMAQAFEIDADLVDTLCNSDENTYIDDYVMRETIIEAGRMIRNETKMQFSHVCCVVMNAYHTVINDISQTTE